MERQQEETRKAEGRNRSQAPNLKRPLQTRLPMKIKKKYEKNEINMPPSLTSVAKI